MKKSYIKPKIEFIELRPEERLAACYWRGYAKNYPKVYNCTRAHGKS